MNVSHMMTKIFTNMNFYKVNMNYMWNDIYTCYVEWYMPTVLSSVKETVSGYSCVFCSRCTYQYTNNCNSIPKITLTVSKMKYISILRYRYQNHLCNDFWHINQFTLLALKSTVNCNYMYNNFYTHEIFQLQMT